MIIFQPTLFGPIQFGSVIFAQGHFRSHNVARVFFLPKTPYRTELNQFGWSHCVNLPKRKN